MMVIARYVARGAAGLMHSRVELTDGRRGARGGSFYLRRALPFSSFYRAA